MDDGRFVHIRVSRSGVTVRASRVRLFGRKLYESPTREIAATFAETLRVSYGDKVTPPGMNDPVLQEFTRAVLRCSTIDDVADVLGGTSDAQELDCVAATG